MAHRATTRGGAIPGSHAQRCGHNVGSNARMGGHFPGSTAQRGGHIPGKPSPPMRSPCNGAVAMLTQVRVSDGVTIGNGGAQTNGSNAMPAPCTTTIRKRSRNERGTKSTEVNTTSLTHFFNTLRIDCGNCECEDEGGIAMEEAISIPTARPIHQRQCHRGQATRLGQPREQWLPPSGKQSNQAPRAPRRR